MANQDNLLKNLFIDIFDLDEEDYCDELSYDDTPDWDSLGHMQMVARLTKEFGVEFDIEEVMAMETVAKIKEIVSAKL